MSTRINQLSFQRMPTTTEWEEYDGSSRKVIDIIYKIRNGRNYNLREGILPM